MSALYNEIDPYAAQWLRNLIAAGHIADGDVDERSIVDVQPSDLAGYDQVHFFAGIGGWSRALRLAGWADDRPVWTGSCPCQPFSAAGKRKGVEDHRHLWPEWFRLVAECRPSTVFGEQVEAAIRMGWLDGVFADLEGAGYACGAAVLGAHSVGAPHIRQRLWWVADSMRDGAGHGSADGHLAQGAALGIHGDPSWAVIEPRGGSASRRLADASGDERRPGRDDRADGGGAAEPSGLRSAGRLGDADDAGLPQRPEPEGRGAVGHEGPSADAPGPVGFWSAFDLLPCTDGKARRVEPGTFPLAHGVPNRVGRLRAYGNAIVPQVAAEFIRAWLDCRP